MIINDKMVSKQLSKKELKEEYFEKVVKYNSRDRDEMILILLAPIITLFYPLFLVLGLYYLINSKKVYWRKVTKNG